MTNTLPRIICTLESMRWIKSFFKFIVVVILLAITLLYIFDYEYILKGVRVVYITGHKTAYIDDIPYFKNRKIKKGTTQKWSFHENYNKSSAPKNLTATNKELGTVAYLVIKDNKLFYENYADSYSNKSLTNSFSMAKSITTALLFKAIDEGYIKSLDTKVNTIFPELKGTYANELTVGDLSSMASGLNWNENYISPFSMTAKAYYDTNIRDLILDLEVNEKPGKKFKYLSGATQLLGMVIEKTTKQHLADYLSKSFWQPMGMESDALWMLDGEKSGLEKSYCCIASNARDFGRFGQLWSNNGKWNNKQLISENLAKLVQDPRFEESPIYSYGLWLSNYKGKKIFYMRGILGQYVISIPEDDLIIVRLGHKRSKPGPNRNAGNDFETYIDAAYNMLSQQNN